MSRNKIQCFFKKHQHIEEKTLKTNYQKLVHGCIMQKKFESKFKLNRVNMLLQTYRN
jgi:hypothetical protein